MKQATEIERMYMDLVRSKKMTPKKKIFLDIMCFAFIGVNSKNNHIEIAKQETKKIENGKIKKSIVYTIVVNDL